MNCSQYQLILTKILLGSTGAGAPEKEHAWLTVIKRDVFMGIPIDNEILA